MSDCQKIYGRPDNAQIKGLMLKQAITAKYASRYSNTHKYSQKS